MKLSMLAGALVVGLTLPACEREERNFEVLPAAAIRSPYDDNAYGTAQGKWLFSQMNCVGCHAHGGGGIGPALMDDQWIYGSEPENIFQSIVQGRPNGMPAFGGKIVPDQIWQLVAYVRSMSGLLRKDVAPGRSDGMQVRSQEQATKKARPVRSGVPPSGEGR
ncbi:MAG: c-type cytochrome [Gemmatimonadales bacterium]